MANPSIQGVRFCPPNPDEHAEAIDALLNVERPQPHHLRWPDLDVDLSLASIERPDRYPLKSRV